GLKGADRTKVYSPSAEKAPRPGGASDLQAHIARSLFLRSFKCPVCGAETKVPAIRSSSVRLLRKDSDFMPYYKDPNPLYYFVEFCRMCGFATLPANIKNLTDRQKRQIREKISASWKFEKEYPSYYTPEVAIEIHKLGLYNAVVSNEKESLRAILSLHIGWLYRILGNAENEKIFLATAREGFERAYENESGPVGGLDKSSQQYLIGELLRRTGNLFGALKWYKMVLLDRTARRAVKEMARDQKDQIMALYESSKRPAAE
ncbi:MAG: DUF2225 domain-containing protein, partial [Clostridiales bacterium]|nr:DUF2225 domain-containing protein [Clostridiales bacterium]